ncbi:MAG: hypothetical protein EOP02_38580, partial [Proteobacteria bacterium]
MNNALPTSHVTIPIAAASVLPAGFLPRDCTFASGDWAVLSRHWYPVARAIDVRDAPMAVTLLDLDLVVYRTPSGIH